MNFGKEFENFHDVIRISSKKRDKLLGNKDALRKKIIKHFQEKEREKPKFYIQGSMDQNVSTGINPLNGDYDIDDGVYLQGYLTDDVTPETAHKWIFDAVDGHTNEPTEDKAKCVRVNYANNEKHVDLPIYIEEDGESYLGIKNKGWIKNKPKEISEWFRDEKNDKGVDFRKAIRFLKAWKDKREDENESLKLFGGFQLSILTSDYFPDDYSNLEEMYYELVREINSNLWKLDYGLANPIDEEQNTLMYYKEGRIKIFKDEFKKMYEQSKSAYEEDDYNKKHKKWKKVFGDRFPKFIDSESKNSLETAPAIILGTQDISHTAERQA